MSFTIYGREDFLKGGLKYSFTHVVNLYLGGLERGEVIINGVHGFIHDEWNPPMSVVLEC